ncbi:MAG: SCP2 domain-containing protein [Bdellovibrionales bacterium]
MTHATMPLPLARLVVSAMPPSALEKATQAVVRRMKTRFPKLFRNLAELPRASIVLDPTDLPHAFLLDVGRQPVSFSVLAGAEAYPAQAKVSGSLEALIDMLEGRADGDMLFFSRDIQVTGDTAIIVALRNTLDRQEINLFEEITGLCGPFAPQARLALTLADRLARRVRARVEHIHEDLHRREQEQEATVL